MFGFLSPTHWLLCTSPSSSSEEKEKTRTFQSRTFQEPQRNFSHVFKYSAVNVQKLTEVARHKSLDKQGRPRSDCFFRSSLIRVFPVQVCLCEFQP